MKYGKLLLCLLIICFMNFGCSNASNDKTPKKGYPINRDVWMVFSKKTLTEECKNLENSPFCLSKSEEICNTNVPISFDQCEQEFRNQIPDKLSKQEVNSWSPILGKCVVEKFIIMIGAGNIDLEKCKKVKK